MKQRKEYLRPHLMRSLVVIAPYFPWNKLDFWRLICSWCIVCTNIFANLGAMPQELQIMVSTSGKGRSLTLISTNLFLNALDNGFLPPYTPGGFWVANSRNPADGFTNSPVSATNNSLLSSNSRFNASSTSDGAKFSSSKIIQYPLRIA